MNAKILVVEDDESTRNLLGDLLTSEGFDVALASSVEEFKEKALANPPHLIILDIMLGNKNGVLFYQNLLASGFDRNIPVLFLSGLVEDHPPTPGVEGRNYALRAKPFIFQEVLQDISSLLVDKN